MRLFGKVDSLINRYDRAGWLTSPFDLAFRLPFQPFVLTPHQYLGRYRLGDYVPLSVECRGFEDAEAEPTAVPTVTVYDSTGAVVTGADDAKLAPHTGRDGWFQRQHRLDSNFSVGRYDALVEYASGGYAFRKRMSFDVVASGNSLGGHIGLQYAPTRRDRYIVGLTDGLTLEQRKRPSLGSYGSLTAGTSGNAMRLLPHVYLGRYRLGDYVPLHVVTRGDATVEEGSTAAPQFTIYSSGGSVITGADDVRMAPHLKPERVGWFQSQHRLDSNFSAGRYDVILSWAEGGDTYSQTASFEVLASGHASGGYVGLVESRGHKVVIAGLAESPATLEIRTEPSV